MHKTPGQVRVSLNFSRHTGPRFVQGGLALSFDSTAPYSFVSRAVFPPEFQPSRPYEDAVRDVVEEVLIARVGALTDCQVVLEAVDLDPVDSSLAGLRSAARAAAEAAFSV
jgi:hypothetical protein